MTAQPTLSSPAEGHATAELRRYLDILARRKWLIVGAVVLVAVVAGVVSSLRTPVYEATAQVLLRQNDPAERLDPAAARVPTDPGRYVRAQQEIAASRTVAEQAAPLVEGVTAKELDDDVEVSHNDQSDVLRISARDPEPERAQAMANAVARGYLENRRLSAVGGLERAATEIEKQLGPLLTLIADLDSKIAASADDPGATVEVQLPVPLPVSPESLSGDVDSGRLVTTVEGLRAARDAAALQYETLYGRLQELRIESDLKKGEAELVDEARLPDDPTSPRPLRDAALGGSIGLLLAVGYVFAREQLDDRVWSVTEVEAISGAPSLAELPYDEESATAESVGTVERPHSPLSEAVRSLRTSIQFLGVDRPISTIVVTSAVPAEGKSVVSANLAAACAQAGMRTLLLSADLRRTGVARLFGTPRSSLGLSDLIAQTYINGAPGTNGSGGRDGSVAAGAGLGGPPVSSAFVRTKLSRLAFLPPGSTPPNPAELLGSERMADLLGELRRAADMIIIDTPPLLAVTDAAVLAGQVDGVILVTALGETRRDALRRAARILDQSKARVLGTVVNKTPERGSPYYYGRYSDADDHPAPGERATAGAGVPRRAGRLGRLSPRR